MDRPERRSSRRMAGCAVPAAMSGADPGTGDRACMYGAWPRSKVWIGVKEVGVMDVSLRVLSKDVLMRVVGVGSNG